MSLTPEHKVYAAIAIVLLIEVLLSIFAYIQLKTFVAEHPQIDSPAILDRFKSVVKTNMLLAVVLISLALIGVLIVAAGFLLTDFGLLDLTAVSTVVAVIFFIMGRPIAKMEGRAKALTVTDESLKVEFDRVVDVWDKRLFADW